MWNESNYVQNDVGFLNVVNNHCCIYFCICNCQILNIVGVKLMYIYNNDDTDTLLTVIIDVNDNKEGFHVI